MGVPTTRRNMADCLCHHHRVHDIEREAINMTWILWLLPILVGITMTKGKWYSKRISWKKIGKELKATVDGKFKAPLSERDDAFGWKSLFNNVWGYFSDYQRLRHDIETYSFLFLGIAFLWIPSLAFGKTDLIPSSALVSFMLIGTVYLQLSRIDATGYEIRKAIEEHERKKHR